MLKIWKRSLIMPKTKDLDFPSMFSQVYFSKNGIGGGGGGAGSKGIFLFENTVSQQSKLRMSSKNPSFSNLEFLETYNGGGGGAGSKGVF
jgi:hypothetical protein